MKSALLASLLILLTGCGGCFMESRWPELPVGVYAEDPELMADVVLAIKIYEKLRPFYPADEAAPITVVCVDLEPDLWGRCHTTEDGGEIRSAFIEIDCESINGSKAGVIGHELWHALGFHEHSDDDDCISYGLPYRNNKLCDEMIEKFSERYHH